MDPLTNGNPVEESIRAGRRATLEALRASLARIIDGSLGHERGCECECGMPWDTGKLAAMSRELREIVRELDDMPQEDGGTEIASIAADRQRRRDQAEAEAARA